VLPSRSSDLALKPGDTFRLETPGGGGYGDPLERDPQQVAHDVRDELISRATAQGVYGVALDPKTGQPQEAETRKLREAVRKTAQRYPKEPTVIRVTEQDVNFMMRASSALKNQESAK
jgi:N-methylhydantoinase B